MTGEGPSVRATVRVVLVVVGVAVALWLVWRLRQPLTWVFFAGFIAVALSTPLRVLATRMRKGVAILLVYLGVVLVPVGVMAVLLPPVIEQGNALAQALPGYATDVQRFVQESETLRRLEQDYSVTERLREQASSLPQRLGDAAGVLRDIGLGVVNSIFAGITILILSVFLLSSGGQWLEAFVRRRPPHEAEMLRRSFDRISRSTGNYFAGAFGQALVAGVTGFLVLLALGMPYAASLALLYGLLDFIPLVGATIGAVLVGIVTLFHDPPTTTIVWTIYAIVYQQVENNLIQPRIQSRAVSLHPFVVLVAVLFGATLLGVLGALIAVPIAAAIQILLRERRRFREEAHAVAAPPLGVASPASAGPATTPPA